MKGFLKGQAVQKSQEGCLKRMGECEIKYQLVTII